MPSQYALVYYLGSTILGSLLMTVVVFLFVNILQGTWHFDGLGSVFLISCGLAMIGSLPFHAWLNWVWNKRVSTRPYEDFFRTFLRNYWLSSSLFLLLAYTITFTVTILSWTAQGGTDSARQLLDILSFYGLVWIAYVPLGWWIIRKFKGWMQPSETAV